MLKAKEAMEVGMNQKSLGFAFMSTNGVGKEVGKLRAGKDPGAQCQGQSQGSAQEVKKQSFFPFILCTHLVNKWDYVGVASSHIRFPPHRQILQDYKLQPLPGSRKAADQTFVVYGSIHKICGYQRQNMF